MFIDQFHSDTNRSVEILPEQASNFAKKIAGDFNPIHDPDSKRFCVPGDLLFSLVLSKYGLSENMKFNFSGMVGQGVSLEFPQSAENLLDICDKQNKKYLSVERSGAISTQESLVESFFRSYVNFSGHNFPHILIPLMAEKNVMINPERPLVIYESMAFHLNHLNFSAVSMDLGETSLTVQGKRGSARLEFKIKSGDTIVGSGFKTLLLSGLREYDESKIQELCTRYETWQTKL